MSTIVSATAFANNEIAVIAWALKVAIPDCMGFEVTRIYTDTGEERVLPAWVPFEGQKNPVGSRRPLASGPSRNFTGPI